MILKILLFFSSFTKRFLTFLLEFFLTFWFFFLKGHRDHVCFLNTFCVFYVSLSVFFLIIPRSLKQLIINEHGLRNAKLYLTLITLKGDIKNFFSQNFAVSSTKSNIRPMKIHKI